MAIDIFLSVGRTANPEQEAFVSALEQLLRDRGFNPCRAQWSAVQPLRKIEEVISPCCGSVILAFERLYAQNAVEFPQGVKERKIQPLRLPTVWNQIEAALVYSRGHPMLVLCEEGLREEGLLERGYDWTVNRIRIAVDELSTRDFQGVFADWSERVKAFKAAPTKKKAVAPTDMTMAELVGSLKPSQLWAALSAFGALLAAVAGIAYTLGQG